MPSTGSRKSRKSLVTQRDHLYEVQGNLGDPCVYCGRVSVSYDHVPPLSSAHLASDRVKVPSCHECNSSLNSMPLTTVASRRSWLKKSYTKRYASVLNTPDWTSDELAEVSPTMREFVESNIRMRDLLRQMLRLM